MAKQKEVRSAECEVRDADKGTAEQENHEKDQAGGDDCQPGAIQLPPLAEWKDCDLRKLDRGTLAALCRQNQLKSNGNEHMLLRRLIGKKRGGDKKHINGGTLCPMCHDMATVESTQGGQRYMKCSDPECDYHFTLPVKG